MHGRNISQNNKSTDDKSTANVILYSKKLQVFFIDQQQDSIPTPNISIQHIIRSASYGD